MRLSISRTLVAIFVAVLALSSIAIAAVGEWVQHRSVSTLAVAESRRHAELIFENLYSVMRKGWTKDEIADLVARINRRNPEITVSVHRSAQVAELFGDISADREARTADPLIAEALDGHGERLVAGADSLRFVYPIRASEECLGCHVNSQADSINGVIDIRFPLEKLRVPLEFTLHTMATVIISLILVAFVIMLLTIRYLVAWPISNLADHIHGLVASGDLGSRLDGRSFRWLYEVRSLTGNFNRLMEALESTQSRLIQQSTTDSLTGLVNRRRFTALLDTEVERALRYGHDLAVIMIDLDGFKPVNDRWGHAIGDRMLKLAAAAMECNVRAIDTVARLGGDEFVVLAPETDPEGARALAAKLAEAIAAESVIIEGENVRVGASTGIALFPLDADSAEQLLRAADRAMYADKAERKSHLTEG